MAVSGEFHDPGPFTRGKEHGCVLNKRLGGPAAWSGFLEENENVFASVGIRNPDRPAGNLVIVPNEVSRLQ